MLAQVMNLSLLTADFWSVLVGVALLGERVGYRRAAARLLGDQTRPHRACVVPR